MQGRRRTGGSALAQAYGQVGADSPDCNMATLRAAFEVTQKLVHSGRVLSGHDVSDGGAAVTVLEMAFAGVAGVKVDLPQPAGAAVTDVLFAEEPGLVLEVAADDSGTICSVYEDAGVPCSVIGATVDAKQVRLSASHPVTSVAATRHMWEVCCGRLMARLPACVRGNGKWLRCAGRLSAGLRCRRAHSG